MVRCADLPAVKVVHQVEVHAPDHLVVVTSRQGHEVDRLGFGSLEAVVRWADARDLVLANVAWSSGRGYHVFGNLSS